MEEPLTQTDQEREERGVHEGADRTRRRGRAQTRWVALAGMLVVVGGCRCAGDEGGPVYARAKARAEALLEEGRAPGDPAFDEVLKDLESVPSDSRFHAQAEALRERLMRARSLAPRPLAQAPSGDDPALAKKEAECVALAQALGRADAGQREGIAKKLGECQAAIDRYREQQHESQTP